jgi:ABC-2 type transport system permease protein
VRGTLEAFRHPQVLRTLVGRGLQRTYTKYRLSYLWTFLEPLGMILVFYFVFNLLLGRTRPLGLQPYLLFLTLAIIPWWWFMRSMSACTKLFRRNAKQVRVSVLPRQLWVARGILMPGVEFLISLPLVLIAAAITLSPPNPRLVLFPLAILLQFILMYGLGLMVAAWTAVLPDLGRMFRVFIRVAFYLSPVIYSVANIPEFMRPYAVLNPMVGILGMYRAGFWEVELEDTITLSLTALSCIAILVLGSIVFGRLEGRLLKAV